MNMKLMMLLFSLLFAATAAAPVYVEDATTGRFLVDSTSSTYAVSNFIQTRFKVAMQLLHSAEEPEKPPERRPDEGKPVDLYDREEVDNASHYWLWWWTGGRNGRH